MRNGEIGELFVAGLNVANGYVNGRDPERFLENPLAVEKSKLLKQVQFPAGALTFRLRLTSNRKYLISVKSCGSKSPF